MTTATTQAFRELADTVSPAGTYQVVYKLNNRVAAFGLTKDRAGRYAVLYPTLYYVREEVKRSTRV